MQEEEDLVTEKVEKGLKLGKGQSGVVDGGVGKQQVRIVDIDHVGEQSQAGGVELWASVAR